MITLTEQAYDFTLPSTFHVIAGIEKTVELGILIANPV